ncbi:MAG: hypothetical protein HQK60_14000 [Deltaproteobacteria bacterium]|nr:hypothetical protein [Deltaproteobacteria bacterium]
MALGEIYERHVDSFTTVMEIVKWTRTYDRIEKAINRAEHLANVIEGIVLKNA